MRTIVGATDKVSASLRVTVKDHGDNWRDISARVKSLSYSDDMESDSCSVSISIRNQYSAYVSTTPNVNLDPLDEDSDFNKVSAVYYPLLARYNEIKVEVTKNAGVNWYEIFRGYVGPGNVIIDTDVEGDDTITVKPVDTSFPYKEFYFYDPLIYKDADAVSIMGQMFADHKFTQSIVETDAPGFHVEEYQTGEINIWESQQKLLEPTGYIYRIKWDSGSSSFKPTVYDPLRTNTTPDWTCDGEFKHRKIDLDESDVRSEVVIFYRLRDVGTLKTFQLSNDSARLKYGIPDGSGGRLHKTMWYLTQGIGARHSMIDMVSEAQTLCEYMLHDLEEPAPDIEIQLPYIHPGIEAHDLISFVGRDYTALVGVMGVSWSIDVQNMVGSTTIKGTVDRVIGQYRRWTARDARSSEVRDAQLLADLQGDGFRPPRPVGITSRSYMGRDASTGKETTITMFQVSEVEVWDRGGYMWKWWLAGENKVQIEYTADPKLLLQGLPSGQTAKAECYVYDWSHTGG